MYAFEDVKFGVAPNIYPLNVVFEAAALAEKAGLDSVMVADHVVAFGIKKFNALDAWSVLSALAVKTKKVRLGTCVSDSHRRHPETLAQMVTTVDFISDGRVILGVGSGEAINLDPFGVEWDHPVSRMREAIEIMKKLWTEDIVNYRGKFYRLKKAILRPKPVQKPHPPIWIGANSPRTMRITAEIGDGWLPVAVNPEHYMENLKRIRSWAREAKRNPEEITPAIFLYTGAGKDSETLKKIFEIPVKIKIAMSEELMKQLGCEPLGPEFNRNRFPFLSPETRKRKFKVLLEKANEIPYGAVERFFAIGTPDKCIEDIDKYVKAGVRYFVLVPYTSPDKFKEMFSFYVKNVLSYFE